MSTAGPLRHRSPRWCSRSSASGRVSAPRSSARFGIRVAPLAIGAIFAGRVTDGPHGCFNARPMNVASPPDVLERLGAEMDRQRPARRLLIIVNPYASTVSDRLKHLVVYALQGRYEVDAVDTQARGHATELCREAAHEGYDVVVAFGGDGTVNEAAHGLAGSDTPLSVLPGGSTNVYCRVLGIPNEIVDATEHLLRLADDWQPRRVDLGLVNGRHFTFSAGLGLDARVGGRVAPHPYRKAKFGEWYFAWAALDIFTRRYLFDPPLIDVGWDD